VFDATALVLVDVGNGPVIPGSLERLTAAFRETGRPVIHATRGALAEALLPDTAPALDAELLREGGVQTLGTSEMAIDLPGAGAFDATPLDGLLRSLGIGSVVVGGIVPSAAVTQTVRAADVRGFRTVLATEELSVVLGAQLTTAGSAA
jgi:nicotinamidase-related amidase